MNSISDIKTDERIGDILNKLREASKKYNKQINDTPKDDSEVIAATSASVEELPPSQSDEKEIHNDISEFKFVDDSILPWFKESDRDTEYLHYIYLNGDTVKYDKISLSRPTQDIAALKLNNNYLCDIDYYNSRHHVLFVKSFDSDYRYSRSFIAANESLIDVEDVKFVNESDVTSVVPTSVAMAKPELTKVSTEVIEQQVADSFDYYHYVVFTDLGIAEFVSRKDETPFPYTSDDLNKWFEETSNYVQLKNTNYSRNENINDTANEVIKDFKYDIITMHRPGVITLDSVDNTDPNYRLHIKLKDEYSFMPIKNVLSCLKSYAIDKQKNINDFKRFLYKYFDIII